MKEFRGQPVILWALAFFFMGLGFRARIDLPLAVLAASSALGFGDQGGKLAIGRASGHWPVVIFLLAALIATAFSDDIVRSLHVQPQLLPALLCYAVITTFVTTVARLQFICISLLFSGLLTSVLTVLASVETHGSDPLTQVRLLNNALMIVPNDVLLISVIAPLVLGVAWQGSRELRWLAALYILANLLVGTVVQSRQAVLLLLLGLVIVVTVMRPRWCVPILLAGILLGTTVDYLLGWPLAGKIFMFPRIYVWHAAWVMFLDSPWTGHGPGMFNDLYFTYLKKAGYVLEQLGDRRTMPWAHNLFLEQLAERGIQGLVAMLILLGSAASRVVHSLRMEAGEPLKALRAGILGAVMVMAAAGIAEATLSRLWVVVLLLCLVGLCHAQVAIAEEPGPPPDSVIGC